MFLGACVEANAFYIVTQLADRGSLEVCQYRWIFSLFECNLKKKVMWERYSKNL